jgi:hypothetical protein
MASLWQVPLLFSKKSFFVEKNSGGVPRASFSLE